MKIGELATLSATPVETIRYHEREGLLPAPGRTQRKFRMYEAGHLERLQFIHYCRSLDMSLDEVRVLLKFRDALEESFGEVNELLDEHIGHVARQLRQLRRRCASARSAQECGVLSGL